MHWHFLTTAPADGPENMALDEALMRRSASDGSAFFRVYGWSSPTLSLGRNQRARGHYSPEAARELGVAIVRRPTGGRSLLHDHEITYCATLPASDHRAAREAYHFINRVLLDGLGRLGVRARLASGGAAIPPGPRPCFDVPSEHEIELDARKLVGSAQWRNDGALLQHGSILVRDDQHRIADLMTDAATTPRAATLFDALGREPGLSEVSGALCTALSEAAGSVLPFIPDAGLRRDAEALRVVYADESWTWRR